MANSDGSYGHFEIAPDQRCLFSSVRGRPLRIPLMVLRRMARVGADEHGSHRELSIIDKGKSYRFDGPWDPLAPRSSQMNDRNLLLGPGLDRSRTALAQAVTKGDETGRAG